jgi:hypothetical protein
MWDHLLGLIFSVELENPRMVQHKELIGNSSSSLRKEAS